MALLKLFLLRCSLYIARYNRSSDSVCHWSTLHALPQRLGLRGCFRWACPSSTDFEQASRRMGRSGAAESLSMRGSRVSVFLHSSPLSPSFGLERRHELTRVLPAIFCSELKEISSSTSTSSPAPILLFFPLQLPPPPSATATQRNISSPFSRRRHLPPSPTPPWGKPGSEGRRRASFSVSWERKGKSIGLSRS